MDQLSNPFEAEPEDTQEAILQATYDILTESGYGSTSIGQIADHVGVSKSVVYHYYDNKEALLLAVLEGLLEQMLEEVFRKDSTDPRSKLEHFLTLFIPAECAQDDPEARSLARLGKTYVELRTQAISNPTYQEQFEVSEQQIKAELSDTIQTGIEQDVLRPVDPERASEHILTFVAGVLFRQATTESVSTEVLQREVQTLLDDRIFN